MSSFHEILFPVDISYGSEGGPKFRTFVFGADSGYEQRTIDWDQTKAEYDVSYGIKDQVQMDAVTAFFYARRGRAYAFRFKDWNDYKLNGATFLGTGEPDVQITKTYTSAQTESGESWTFVRKITKPAWATVSGLTVDGVVKTSPADYSVDYTTGIITFVSAPAEGAVIVIGAGEFHVPVRFDTDHLNVKHEFWNTVSWDQIGLVEDRTDWDSFFTVTTGGGGDGGGGGTALWSADFKNGVYLLSGAASTLSAMFTDSPSYTLNPADVISGFGLQLATPALNTAPMALVAGGATYLLEFYVTNKWSRIAAEIRAYNNPVGVFSSTSIEEYSSDDALSDFSTLDFNNGADNSTSLPPLSPGNHKMAVTMSLDSISISLDGDTVETLSGTRAPTAVANYVTFKAQSNSNAEDEPTAYITKITAYATMADSALPALATNTVVPPASPPTAPGTPTMIWEANFGTGTYTLNGSTVTVNDILVEDGNFASFNPATDISGGVLRNTGPTLTAAVMADVLQYGGATFVITGTKTGTGGSLGSIGLYDNTYFYEGLVVDLKRTTSSTITIYSDFNSPYVVSTPILTGTGAVKAAITIMEGKISVSINGQAVTTHSVGLLGAVLHRCGILCNNLSISDIKCYTPYADAALPGLST